MTHHANRDWQPRSGGSTPTRFTRRWLVPLFGVAAMLALFAMITVLRDRPSPAPTGQRLYVQALERVSTEGEIMNYLDRSQALVLTLMDRTPTCEDGRIEIGAEKELARDLIYQKKLLDVQLTRPMHQDFKNLCDDLETLLLDVAVSDSCVGLETLQLWQHVLESRSMLMKMNLLRMEGRI